MYTDVYNVAGGGVAVSEAFPPTPNKQALPSPGRAGLPSQLLPSPGRARRPPSSSPSLKKRAPQAPSPGSHFKTVIRTVHSKKEDGEPVSGHGEY